MNINLSGIFRLKENEVFFILSLLYSIALIISIIILFIDS